MKICLSIKHIVLKTEGILLKLQCRLDSVSSAKYPKLGFNSIQYGCHIEMCNRCYVETDVKHYFIHSLDLAVPELTWYLQVECHVIVPIFFKGHLFFEYDENQQTQKSFPLFRLSYFLLNRTHIASW